MISPSNAAAANRHSFLILKFCTNAENPKRPGQEARGRRLKAHPAGAGAPGRAPAFPLRFRATSARVRGLVSASPVPPSPASRTHEAAGPPLAAESPRRASGGDRAGGHSDRASGRVRPAAPGRRRRGAAGALGAGRAAPQEGTPRGPGGPSSLGATGRGRRPRRPSARRPRARSPPDPGPSAVASPSAPPPARK